MALAMVVLTLGGSGHTHSPPPMYHGQPCAKTFTLPQFERAVNVDYAGARDLPGGATGTLMRFATCLRAPKVLPRAIAYWASAKVAWQRRRAPIAVASWYDDSGATASGFHAVYGVANKYVSFGTHVEICYPAHSPNCIDTIVDDRGPYVGGRDWDLNQNVAGALGFPGVATVSYQLGR